MTLFIDDYFTTYIESFVEGALQKLVKAGELKREGLGKGTYYVRLN